MYLNKYHFSQKVVDQFFEHDYQDRGMTKWQGFYLSDHTVAIKKQRYKNKHVAKIKNSQTIALIKQRLYYAMKNNYEVTIQLNELDSELKPIEVSGQIEFLNDDEFRLAQKNEMLLENIRNVSFSIE